MVMSSRCRPPSLVDIDDEWMARRGDAEPAVEVSDRDDVAAIHLATPRHLAPHDQRGQLVGVHVRQPGRLHQGVASLGSGHDATASLVTDLDSSVTLKSK